MLLRDWIQTVTPEMLPAVPWTIKPGETVNNNRLYLEHLKREAAKGEKSPYTRWGRLQDEIKQLYEKLNP